MRRAPSCDGRAPRGYQRGVHPPEAVSPVGHSYWKYNSRRTQIAKLSTTAPSRPKQATFSGPPKPAPPSRQQVKASRWAPRSEEHTSELQSLMPIAYAVFCFNKKKHMHNNKV